MRSTGLVIFFVGWVASGLSALAQDDLGPERIGDVLPSAAIFGEGWTTLGPSFVPRAFENEDAVLASRGQYYTGDRGARALVDVVLPAETFRDARVAWDEMTIWVNQVESHTYDDESLGSWELTDIPPPVGCVDAVRGEGLSYIDTAPAGATLCDTGEGYYIYAMVSGAIENNGIRYDYHTASDMIVSAMLGHGPLAPRVATPAA